MITHLRIGLRMLAARPWLAAGRLVTVTTVVAAATAVFTVANATLLRPLPFPQPERLMRVYLQPPGTTDLADANPLDPFEFVRLRGRVQFFEQVEGIWAGERAVGGDREPDSILAGRVSAGFFAMLGAPVALGRVFTDEEAAAGARVVVLSEGLWMRRFAGDRAIVGRTLIVDREPHLVLGVTGRGFEPAFTATEFWTPLTIAPGAAPALLTAVQTLGRLREGASVEQARGELAARLEAMRQEAPSLLNGWTMGVRELRDAQFGSRRPAILTLLAAAAALALIAIGNLVNLTLADLLHRRADLGIRAALGGSRRQIAAPEIIQALLIAIAGGLLGMWAAARLVPALLMLDPSIALTPERLAADWRVAICGLGVALVVMVAAVAAPVVRLARPGIALDVATGDRRISGGPLAQRVRIGLVSAQTALAIVLVSTGALVIGSLHRAAGVDPGFDARHVLTAQLRLSAAAFPTETGRAAFVEQVLDRVSATPGVVAAGTTLNPFRPGDSFQTLIHVEDRPTPDGQPRTVQFRRVSPGYFEAMRIPLVKGRQFSRHDRVGAPLAVIVSRSFVRQFWPDEDPIGKRIRRGSSARGWSTVIGVVDDVHDSGLGQPIRDTVYASYFQASNAAAPIALVVRTAVEPGGLVPAIQAAVWTVDPSQPLGRIATLESFLDASLGPQRFRAWLIAICGVLGVVLATIGTYGMAARSVVERRSELGIRLALGGRRPVVCAAILRGTLRAVVTGAIVGTAVSAFAHEVVRAVLTDVGTGGWRLALGTAGVLIAAGVSAAVLAARRAAAVDPLQAMRGK